MIKSKLSIKLLWYVTPLVIVPLLFLGGFALSNVTQFTERQAELSVSQFVDQQQQKISNYTEVFHSTTELLSNSPVLIDFLEAYNNKPASKTVNPGSLLDVFVSYINAYPDILSIDLITPEGKSIAFYSSDLFATSDSYHFTENLRNSSIRRQQFMHQNEQGSTSLYFAQQIFKSDYQLESPKLMAYLIVHLDPSVLNTSILEAPFENTLNIVLNEQGKILFSSNIETLGHYLTEFEYKSIVDAAERSHLVELKLSTLDNQERMVYANQMNGGAYYVSSIPKNILYESGKAITLFTALVVIASIIFLPILIFIVVRSLLLTPLEMLAEASHRVGDGDLKILLPIEREDEMGSLFQDFNHMVSQIRHYQGQLEDYKEHLEEKVAARTHELAKMNHQLEKAMNQAEQASQLKSRFLANMSHEIRTPLTAIMGFTEQMLTKEPDDKKAQHLNTVLRNSKHLLELINNILDLSKIEAEKLEVERQPLELSQLIEDINSVVHVLAQDKNLTFAVEYDYPLPRTLNSDITRLKQVLLNVCTNAVKFTAEGSVTLAISAKHSLSQLEFKVQDTGIGMSNQELERIFKPFEQADSSTTRKFGGTGLGLCISKNLAQLLGGDITVTSKQTQGSCFLITVACHNEHIPVDIIKSATDLAQLKPALAPIKNAYYQAQILVAEDNPDNQELIRLLLEQWGLEPHFADNGAQAVEMALTHDFDLILMDMQMPVMGGLEATTMLRNTAYDGPIIALTANVMKNDIDTYIAAGCNQSLAKPIDKQELENALEKYLSLQHDNNKKWEDVLKTEQFKKISLNYKAKMPEMKTQLTDLYESEDWEQLTALAHSIKGSAGCFGFTHISDAASELESCLKDKNQQRLDYQFLKLEQSISFTLQMD
ncbi:hybrid sensor histidine kinase/response regulator [Pseudoalteromonas tunicata]|uniref:histidine kinase n=1 Tax=Pseudoalteromonas tunicata D2 TaxID=87626 RepID=A4C6X7_9GAMM|nr:hybrid sensor histidine kinase/response regulator [Pseudoalteromonas tunicata]ATC95701.1 hypothetical protein PTUN_a3357 [Pseudoalteromonas tunicata]AXT31258.1 hybrid sensor histidine kinase/response regulator [Pseudoalteromonas tunicata]EAR29731.1 hypothetical protein PTD2_12964 [Pseudoalteromonas tunicata D2]MDP4985062.1 ATP-binding protein [Pseudoalteromonas tunicata]